jgi:hypothetical protein
MTSKPNQSETLGVLNLHLNFTRSRNQNHAPYSIPSNSFPPLSPRKQMLQIVDAAGGQLTKIPAEVAVCIGVFRDMIATVTEKKQAPV